MKKRLLDFGAKGRGFVAGARGWVAAHLLGLTLGVSVAGLGAGVVVTAVDPGWVSGGESGSTTIRNLSIVLAGLVALPLAVWRGVVANRQARAAREQAAAAQRQAETSQEDLRNKRYQDSAGMLGSETLAVRLAGIYALQRLAEEHPEQYHIEIMKLLCAFVRHPAEDEVLYPMSDHALIAITREDDYTFGVLHSRAHELWSLRMGTSLEDRPRYTPTTTFETFPFPWPLDRPDAALTAEQRGHREAIGAAARALDTARRRWLNPPEWVREEPDVVASLPPRLLPVDEAAARQLSKRTLTNLYNARPAWLANLHRDLDAAVFAAYGWAEAPEELGEEEVLERLLGLNLERGS